MSVATPQSAPSIRHLVGKFVVVVGGSSGVGYCVARVALEYGAKVLISSSNQTKVDAAVSRLLKTNPLFDGSISGLTVNAKDVKSIESFWDKVGKFDHLVWTAGDSVRPDFMQQDIETQKAFFDVRFWAPVISAKYAQEKGLFNPGASMTMSTGVVNRHPMKGFAIGAAVSGAIDSVTRGLAVELAPVRVNTVSMGGVETELWDGLIPDIHMKEATKKFLIEHSLVKHLAQPEEIAEAYLFVMKCTNVTGQTIEVEGGALLT
ncbi:NAD(P)-binding protein [Calocera cornea HHB12733]|uniref:NAD(P)-binding protein n=1 Tax=Calocera cornea HHB12733 TaxID=1353952 RepID=A0A165C8B2_9BASI|nr:NAD(P)-binding protein [Calocera cornea HHB12733]